jgi:hypothetical protein
MELCILVPGISSHQGSSNSEQVSITTPLSIDLTYNIHVQEICRSAHISFIPCIGQTGIISLLL